MVERTEFFLVAVSTFAVAMTFVATKHLRRSRVGEDEEWKRLIARVSTLNRDNIAIIATDEEFSIESAQLSKLIGGMQGLEAIALNCDVLIELACYVQRWYPEALVVAEELRLNAREIQWHLGRLKGARSAQNFEANFTEYGHRAISVYFAMTRIVLDLYERTECPGLSDLRQAI